MFHTHPQQVSELHMLETYKSRVDKFALCEGRPSTDNLFVLQVCGKEGGCGVCAYMYVKEKKREGEGGREGEGERV